MTTPNSPEQHLPLSMRSTAEVAGVLQDFLGQKLVAYAIAETDPRQIGLYASSEMVPDEDTEQSLRKVAHIVDLVAKNVPAETLPESLQARLLGLSGDSTSEALVDVLHMGDTDRAVRSVETHSADIK